MANREQSSNSISPGVRHSLDLPVDQVFLGAVAHFRGLLRRRREVARSR
jgi:hypothetical protein